jgi:protein-S-isoprenylcysteine O-methyltransferase Ste14
VYFVAAGFFGAVAVVLHLLGPQVATFLRDLLGSSVPGTAIVVAAWVLTVAAALLLYHGLMRAAAEQDIAEERRAHDLAEWQSRRQPGPPASFS